MAKPAQTRAQLRKHYVFDRLSLEQAATLVKVSYTTASRWKKQSEVDGDDWDKLKTASSMASGDVEQLSRQILMEMLVQFQSIQELIKGDAGMPAVQRVELLSSLMDNIHKSMSAMRRFLPETNALATGMQVLRGLADFVQTKFPQHGAAFVEILEPFGDELARILGENK